MKEEATASGEAGTFALIHYDIWHRSTPNLLGTPRFMLKFEFMRTAAPVAPSWNNQELSWSAIEQEAGAVVQPTIVGEEVWNWLSGDIGSLAGSKADDAAAIAELYSKLTGDDEPSALSAAYELAARGPAERTRCSKRSITRTLPFHDWPHTDFQWLAQVS